MNGNEHVQAHAAEAKRVSNEVHSKALDPTMAALDRKHATLEAAKSDARQRSMRAYRNPEIKE
jgi:hypothetical protein